MTNPQGLDHDIPLSCGKALRLPTLHPLVVRCRIVTSRHSSRRPVLPVLAALLVGASTAGAATVLAKPTDALAGSGIDTAASYTQVQWPGGAAGRPAPRAKPTPVPTRPADTAPPTSSTTVETSTPAPTTTTTRPDPTTTTNPPLPDPPALPAAPVERVVALVNQARVENGCDAVSIDPRLNDAARAHAEDMSGRDYFSHTSPEGVTFDKRITGSGYPTPGAENIARGQQSPEAVMDAWMKSKGHKANILNCQLTTIGIGLDPDGFYWVQDFGF